MGKLHGRWFRGASGYFFEKLYPTLAEALKAKPADCLITKSERGGYFIMFPISGQDAA